MTVTWNGVLKPGTVTNGKWSVDFDSVPPVPAGQASVTANVTVQAVKDFQWALCLVDKKDDTLNKLMPIGGIRIWVNTSKLATKKKEFPYGD